MDVYVKIYEKEGGFKPNLRPEKFTSSNLDVVTVIQGGYDNGYYYTIRVKPNTSKLMATAILQAEFEANTHNIPVSVNA